MEERATQSSLPRYSETLVSETIYTTYPKCFGPVNTGIDICLYRGQTTPCQPSDEIFMGRVPFE